MKNIQINFDKVDYPRIMALIFNIPIYRFCDSYSLWSFNKVYFH